MKPLNILLFGRQSMEDEVLRQCLDESGHPCQRIEDMCEALDILWAMKTDLLIINCDSGETRLRPLIKETRRNSPDTQILIIAGEEQAWRALCCAQAMSAVFLCRPLKPHRLKAVLNCFHERIGEILERDYYIDEIERLLEEKAEALKRAEKLSQLGQTVGELSHSIKNIVSGLKGGMYVLEQGVTTHNEGYIGEGWGMVKRNVERISSLAMELLKLVKEPELIMTLRDPNDPPREVFKLMELRAWEQGSSLELDLAPRLPEVYMDADAIHSCLLNLVTNAIDACNESRCVEKARILLQTRPAEDGGVEYRIIDNGCGMDDAVARKLFRCLISTKGAKGTGLGLLVTKRIIDAHGGTIDVESVKSLGTTFTIHLPAPKD